MTSSAGPCWAKKWWNGSLARCRLCRRMHMWRPKIKSLPNLEPSKSQSTVGSFSDILDVFSNPTWTCPKFWFFYVFLSVEQLAGRLSGIGGAGSRRSSSWCAYAQKLREVSWGSRCGGPCGSLLNTSPRWLQHVHCWSEVQEEKPGKKKRKERKNQVSATLTLNQR